MVSEGPEAIRRRVRDWLSDLLYVEGFGVTIDDPSDWSGWDESRRQ